MQVYYLYLLDGGGHVARRVEISAHSDAAAIQAARSWPHEQGKELWRLAELIWGSEREPG